MAHYVNIPPGADWLQSARDRAKTLSGSMDSEYFNEWCDNDGFASTLTGASTIISSLTEAGGILDASTSGAASGSAFGYPKGTPCLYNNMIAGGQPFYLQMRLKFGTVDANALYYISIKPSATPSTGKAAAFGVFGSVSTAFLNVEMYDGAAAVTDTVTTVPIDTTAYHDLAIFTDGTTYSFFYDGAVATTVPASQLGAGATPALWMFISSSGNATLRTLLVDKTYTRFKGQ